VSPEDRLLLPLRYRLGLPMALLVGTFCALLYVYVPARLHRQNLEALADKARTVARIVAYSASPAVVFDDSAGITEAIGSAAQDPDLRGIEITAEGNASVGRRGTVVGGPQVVSGLAAVEHEGRSIGQVRVMLSTATADRALVESRRRIALGSLVLFAVSLLATAALSTRVTGPLSRVVQAAEAIARGGALTRVEVRSRDEVGQLAATFNLMIARLHAAHEELRAANTLLEERVDARTAELRDEVRERTRAEAGLRASEQRFRAIFESAAIGIVLLDTEGVVRDANGALLGMLEMEAAAVVGRPFREVVTPGELHSFDSVLRTAEAGESSAFAELRLEGRRPRTAVCGFSPLLDGVEPTAHLLGVIEDVTEQRALEQQLLQAQKLEAVGRLAGGIAHDFNNLLTSINGLSDLVTADLEPGPIRNDVQQIRAAGERAAQLTRQLLAFSRRQVLQPQRVDLNAIVREVAGMLYRVIAENIIVGVELTGANPTLRADPGQVSQVLMNLAVNARDAMPTGGRLDIRTAVLEADHDTARRLELPGPGAYAQLTVVDTGCGMSEETRAHAFEPFFTTKPPGEGTGLGLATVYGIVKQSGGGIVIESEVGRGTSMRILLPVEPGDVAARPEPEEGPGLAATATVLVVEDEVCVRRLVTRVLQREGLRVLEAENAAAALELSRTFGEPIELLVTDVIMPGMSGPELSQALRRERPELRVILMSGYTPDAVRSQGLIAPDTAFVEKPMAPSRLVRAVRDALEGPPEPFESPDPDPTMCCGTSV
jgi:PAS domain S-box-containing protein